MPTLCYRVEQNIPMIHPCGWQFTRNIVQFSPTEFLCSIAFDSWSIHQTIFGYLRRKYARNTVLNHANNNIRLLSDIWLVNLTPQQQQRKIERACWTRILTLPLSQQDLFVGRGRGKTLVPWIGRTLSLASCGSSKRVDIGHNLLGTGC